MNYLVIISLTLLVLAFPAQAASIECDGIDDSATTHFPDSDTSSTTTTGKDCTVSIAGVTASSANAATSPNCVQTLGQIRFPGINDPGFFSRVAVPFAASWSVPGFPSIQLDMAYDFRPDVCRAWADSVTSGIGSVDGLADAFDLDEGELAAIGNCVLGGSDGGQGIGCEQREVQVLVRFSSPFGTHLVSLPRP